MGAPYRHKITGPGAWRSADMEADTSWVMELETRDIDEIDAALRALNDRGTQIPFSRADFPLQNLAERLDDIPAALEDRQGFVVVRALPRERYSSEDCASIYWGIATHLGQPVSQNRKGELICHVRDEGRSLKDPDARGYQTTAKLEFHCDLLPVDVLGLFCLRTAKSGGASYLVSSLSVHNVMLDEHPDLLDALYEPFHADWRGDQPDGETPWYTNPLYSYFDGKLTSRVTTRFVFDSVTRFGDELALSERQSAALDAVHKIAARPDMQLAIGFEEGDMQFVNNHMILHARGEYEDHEDPALKRHLMRMWIALPPGRRRALAPDLAHRYAHVEAGGIIAKAA